MKTETGSAIDTSFTEDLDAIMFTLGKDFQRLHTRNEFEILNDRIERVKKANENDKLSVYGGNVQSLYTAIVNLFEDCGLGDPSAFPEALTAENNESVFAGFQTLAKSLKSQVEVDQAFLEEVFKVYTEYKSSKDYIRRLVLRRLKRISPSFVLAENSGVPDAEGQKGQQVLRGDIDDISTELLIFKQFLKQFWWCEGVRGDDDHGKGYYSVRIRHMCFAYVLGNAGINELRKILDAETGDADRYGAAEHFYKNYVDLAKCLGQNALEQIGFTIESADDTAREHFNISTIAADLGESLLDIIFMYAAGMLKTDDAKIDFTSLAGNAVKEALLSDIDSGLARENEIVAFDDASGHRYRLQKRKNAKTVFSLSFSLPCEAYTLTALSETITAFMESPAKTFATYIADNSVDITVTQDKIDDLCNCFDQETFDFLVSRFTGLQKKKDNNALVSFAQKLGKGIFQKNTNSRESLYVFAIAFEMTVSFSGEIPEKDSDAYQTDVRKNLFFDYYSNNLINMLELRDSETDITGYGINYKNFAEITYVRSIMQEGTALEKLKETQEIICHCLNRNNTNRKSADQIENERLEEDETWNPELTDIFVRNFLLHLNDEKDAFCKYLLSNYVCKYEDDEIVQGRTIRSYQFGAELRTAGKIYDWLTSSKIRSKRIVENSNISLFYLSISEEMTEEEKDKRNKFNTLVNAFTALIQREQSVCNFDQGQKESDYENFRDPYGHMDRRDAYGNKILLRSDLFIAAVKYLILVVNQQKSPADQEKILKSFSDFYEFVTRDFQLVVQEEEQNEAKIIKGINAMLLECGFMEISSKSIFDLMLLYSVYRRLTALFHIRKAENKEGE